MPPKRRKMLAFKIDEISGVDNPAQEGARVAIMKRADGPAPPPKKPVEKRVASALTSIEDGHQHGIEVEGDGRIWVSYSMGPDDTDSHNHAIARLADGTYVLSMTAGHTHTIDQLTVAQALLALTTTKRTDPMPDKPTIEDLQKQLDRTNSIVALGADDRAHFDGLEAEAQDAFVAKSADERTVEIVKAAEAAEAAKGADPVVYTTADGVELRKSAGEPVIAMAKRLDKVDKENALLKAQREQDALEKRAEEELSHLPGDVKSRAALLKAAESIEDEEQRKEALDALKANNEAMATAFETRGHQGTVPPGSPEAELDKMAKEYAEKHDDVTPEAAYAKVLETPEGGALYTKTLN